jgi:hypothetical protein
VCSGQNFCQCVWLPPTPTLPHKGEGVRELRPVGLSRAALTSVGACGYLSSPTLPRKGGGSERVRAIGLTWSGTHIRRRVWPPPTPTLPRKGRGSERVRDVGRNQDVT